MPYSSAVKPFFIRLESGDITLTRVIPSASISAAISSVIKLPEVRTFSEGLEGFIISSVEYLPIILSRRGTISLSPSMMAFLTTPSLRSSSSQTIILSIATSHSLRVK